MRRANSTLSAQHLKQQWNRTNRNIGRSQHHHTLSVTPICRAESYLMQQTQSLDKHQKRMADDRLYCLQKQIVQLQQQISSSKASVKNYAKELTEYQHIIQHIEQLQMNKVDEMQTMAQLNNRLHMMYQQRHSMVYNADERVSQKQYYQQLIASYKRQYQQQSIRVLQTIQLQQQAVMLSKSLQEVQSQIKQAQNKLRQWKQQTSYELNQHKIRNNIKLARIELIKLQDKCDTHCHQYKLKTIRQLCCQFFKSYAKKHGIGLQQLQSDGPDLYICRLGAVDQYKQYVSERIIYNKPQCQQFNEYFCALLSIQKIYSSNLNKINNNTHSIQVQQLSHLKQLKHQQTSLLRQCRQSIDKTNVQIEKHFGLDSLAVIEYLRECNNNKYDIKQIRNKLKQNKKEMNSRINTIKQAYHSIKHLDSVIRKDMISNKIPNQATINCIRIEINNQLEILAAVEIELQKYSKDKNDLQTYISNAVSKWRQREEKKDKLKSFYLQLQQQTNNYVFTKNQQPKEQPVIQDRAILQSTYSNNKLVRRDSSSSLMQSKSVLALSNPFKNIMDRQSNTYQSIIEDCQLILSKQPNRHKPKQSNHLAERDTVKKNNMLSRSQKQNQCLNKSVKSKSMLMSQTNYTISAKPSITLQSNHKPKHVYSQKQSLSKLLMSKFNR